jgi:hypothetical protein
VLTHIIMAVLGAALGIGLLLSFYSPSGGPSLPGSGAVPSPGTSAAPLSGGEQAIVSKVKPGLVIINATLQYDSEIAAGTGMVINADGRGDRGHLGEPVRAAHHQQPAPGRRTAAMTSGGGADHA